MGSAASTTWEPVTLVEHAFEEAACGLLVVGRDGVVHHANPAAVALVADGWPVEGVPARLDQLFPPPPSNPGLTLTLNRAVSRGIDSLDLPTVDRSGRRRVLCWMVSATAGMFVVAVMDVTARRALGDQLAHLAFHDPLTGLANRTLLLQRLQHALRRRERVGGEVAVLFVDLDRFKEVNDTLGHEQGDRLLTLLADRLGAVVRPTDTVGRLGGDEFLVVCEDVADRAAAELLVERMLAAVEEPFAMDGHEAAITASIGLSITDEGSERDAVSLLREADQRMYDVKRRRAPLKAGPRQLPVAASGPPVGRPAVPPAAPVSEAPAGPGPDDLRRALAAGEIVLAYQPQISLHDGRVDALECLVRWRHPELGELLPEDFLPMAETSGLVVELGRHVLGLACRQGATWARTAAAGDRRPPVVAVNVSRTELADGAYPERVAEALAGAGLAPRLLRLEVARPMHTGPLRPIAKALQRLRLLRVGLSVDGLDVVAAGTDALADLPVQEMKLGPAAVRHVDDADGWAPVRGVDVLANAAASRGMRLVATGVESDGQLAAALRLGATAAQGHWFAPPQPVAVAHEVLEADLRFRRDQPAAR